MPPVCHGELAITKEKCMAMMYSLVHAHAMEQQVSEHGGYDRIESNLESWYVGIGFVSCDSRFILYHLKWG